MLLLVAGAAAGIALAASGLVDASRRGGAMPRDAVAVVNGAPIRQDEYERTLAAVANDRRAPLDAADKRHVLDRLIDEELLVQRGLELGLPQTDRKLRADLTSAMIAAVTAEVADGDPTDADARAFYDTHRTFFMRTGRLRIRTVFVRTAADETASAGVQTAQARAVEAVRRLRDGEDVATVRAALGDTEVAPVPDTLLPVDKLGDYLGPTAARTALTLAPGAVSEPIRSAAGFHVVQVVERQADYTPPFDDVRAEVLAEFHRRAGDRALRTYLDELRTRADVRVGSGVE
jgi:hypothetical protein